VAVKHLYWIVHLMPLSELKVDMAPSRPDFSPAVLGMAPQV
jgi:hypothetical protein